MKNPIPADALPPEGYVVEVGGKFNSEYGTFIAALKAGLELKNKNSQIKVKVSDAAHRTRPPGALSAPSQAACELEE